MVHLYERYAWMVVTVIMFMLWGLGAKAGYDINAQKPLEDTGINLIADILSFGGIVYGSFSVSRLRFMFLEVNLYRRSGCP